MQKYIDSFPNYLAFLDTHLYLKGFLWFLLVLTVANLLKWVLLRLIKKITEKTKLRLSPQIIDLLEPPLFFTVLIVGATIAISIAGISEKVAEISTNILQSILVLIWTKFLINGAAIALRAVARFPHVKLISTQTLPLFQNLILLVIIAGAIYFIFSLWGIDMTAWLASAGVAGIAIGFAAKDTLANLIAGVFILADAPYKVGDYVVLDSGERGKVTHIGVRSTRLLTRDDVEITVPNSLMGNSKITNQSGGGNKKMRVKIPIGVAYDTDIEKAETAILSVTEGCKIIANSPSPRVRLRNFGASSIDFELLLWIKDPEQTGLVQHEINKKIFKKLKEENIEIPYSKQDLYIKEMPKK